MRGKDDDFEVQIIRARSKGKQHLVNDGKKTDHAEKNKKRVIEIIERPHRVFLLHPDDFALLIQRRRIQFAFRFMHILSSSVERIHTVSAYLLCQQIGAHDQDKVDDVFEKPERR